MNGHLEHIKVFLTVAEAGGFSTAAKAMGVSASSVTRAVAELEASLGVQLLKRTTRKVSLTQAGQDYVRNMRPLLTELDRVDDAARAHQTDLQGRLRISAPLSFGTIFLAEPLAAFRREHPGIDLSIQLTDRFVDIMAEEFDMALRISGAPRDRSTIWRKIRLVPRSLVASPGYLSSHGVPTEPMDLSRHVCLSYGAATEAETWDLTDPADGTTYPVRPRFRFGSNNGELLAQMATADQGIALLPDFVVSAQLDAGSLRRVLPRWSAPDIWLTAFYPPYSRLPAALAKFTAKIEAAASEMIL